jgi:hypothetical protein
MDAGATFAGNLFFPRASHRLRSMWKFARRQEQMWGEVREHVGREPTPDEVFEYFHPHEPD